MHFIWLKKVVEIELNLKFNHKLVVHLAKGTTIGVLSTNILAILFSSLILYNYIPKLYIFLWFIVSMAIIILRLFFTRKFFKNKNSNYDLKYIKITMFLMFCNAILLNTILYQAIYFNANISSIFIIILLIMAIVAGSTNSVGGIFPAFLVFSFSNFFLLILNITLLDIESLNILLMIVFTFSIFFIGTGYRNYKLLKTHIELEKKHRISEEKLKKLNDSLEKKIKEEVDKNTKQLEILQQQTKMAQMGEMIGAIAHQWRQPLNGISTSIQNLQFDYEDGFLKDEKYVKEFIDKNKKTIKFMSNTIDDFRNFFRVDKEKKNFKVKHAIESVVSIYSSQLVDNNITLHISGEESIAFGFRSEFKQVILNIISNAKDALVENKIKNPYIDIEIQGSKVVMEDNAGGIPQNILERIFEPYFTTKEQGKGTGMGLYMSKMIIEDNMGGRLSVENVDGGARFMIDLNTEEYR